MLQAVVSGTEAFLEVLHGASAEAESAIQRHLVARQAPVDDARTAVAGDVRNTRDARAVVAAG